MLITGAEAAFTAAWFLNYFTFITKSLFSSSQLFAKVSGGTFVERSPYRPINLPSSLLERIYLIKKTNKSKQL